MRMIVVVPLHRADRRQRGRHRRADRLPRHGRVPRVHRRIPLSGRSPVRNRNVTEVHPIGRIGREARVSQSTHDDSTPMAIKGEGQIMKRALGLVLVVAAVVAIAFTVGTAAAAPAKKQDTSLSGAGSSFVFPLVSKWIPALGSAYGYSVSYSPIGSGGGIAADHGPHGRLRRLRRAAQLRIRWRRARAASRFRGRCRPRRSPTTCPGSTASCG